MKTLKGDNNKISLCEMMGIDGTERQLRKDFINFNDEDVKTLKELSPIIRGEVDWIIDKFYSNLENHKELINVIDNAGSNITRLKETQKRYLNELFMGEYNEDYFERRLKIGVVHNTIGLEPKWYLGGYSVYLNLIMEIVKRKFRFRPWRISRYFLSISKLLAIDSQLAIETYVFATLEDLKNMSVSKGDLEGKVSSYKDFIEKVSAGDLSHRIQIEGDDDLSQMGHQLNEMTKKLSLLTKQTTKSTNVVYTNVEQLEKTAESQAAGAAEQASSVSETTTTLEAIMENAKQTLEKTKALGQLAERTRTEGEKGQAVLQKTIATMKNIREKVEAIAQTILALSEHSQQVGDITNSVGSLAQQSKMLALNASIEAAKAGEAGKGFAVVAIEVKDLAEQSQQATDQVKKLLQDIQHATDQAVMSTEEGCKGVDEGVTLIDETGNAVNQLSDVIHEASVSSKQIVAAVQQQASAIEQINASMQEIKTATQLFVTSTQETKDATTSIRTVAKELHESVNVYILGNEDGA
ncbi:MAG: hypothetical protein CMF50_04405 [Legionellales bacterium]|nr:hypothetical protein [Legionellales bacterium]|tara:strand:+ start:3373 stop:4944 length:1572 start_codon:yes stop_codon:yes gene_type:complete